jgi:hypothetical protein
MFASVPPHRLKQLHRLLERFPGYGDPGRVVAGVAVPPRRGEDRLPTALEALTASSAVAADRRERG